MSLCSLSCALASPSEMVERVAASQGGAMVRFASSTSDLTLKQLDWTCGALTGSHRHSNYPPAQLQPSMASSTGYTTPASPSSSEAAHSLTSSLLRGGSHRESSDAPSPAIDGPAAPPYSASVPLRNPGRNGRQPRPVAQGPVWRVERANLPDGDVQGHGRRIRLHTVGQSDEESSRWVAVS